MDIYEESLKLHKKHQGKLEIKSKFKVSNKHELSLAYSPGVAEVSSQIGKNKELAYSHTMKGNTIAVVSDGSAILGLGNLGAEAAIPVMEGKCILFKEFAGVDALPICLATQDVEEIVQTVKQIAPTFGGINLEDISAPRCFEVERRLKEELDIPVMHDDQHGTATVVLAGLINALRLKNKSEKEAKVIISGAGAAGTAIADLLHKYGFSEIIVIDSQGAIYAERKNLSAEKALLASYTNKHKKKGSLPELIVGADIFIGVSVAGALSISDIKRMAKDPVVFALANPSPEIMPDEAKSAGAYVVATGRSDYPNQINNVLVFPGVFRGALDNGVSDINDEMLQRAALNLANLVENLSPEEILPSVFDKRVAKAVALAIKEKD